MRALAVATLLALGLCSSVAAHEVRPAYLQLREAEPERFDVLFKVPARGELRLSLTARLPERCLDVAPHARFEAGGSITERWRVRCPGGLAGGTIAIEGLEGTLTDALVRIENADGSSQLERLAPTAPGFVVAATPDALQVARAYLGLGIQHIAFGLDHLLFVLGLLLLVDGRRRLIATITAFTVAHSVTLAAATLGWVHLAQQPVEAVIALSIVFVAGEIAHERQGRAGWTRRWPWLVAGSFGLLHGFGFAGALREVGLPESAIPLALLFFNLGVELGQLGFIGLVLGVAALASRLRLPQPAWSWRLPAYGIGSLAAYWTIARVAGFWS
jgi:hydrogenase/urease accessory protein HupE